MKHFSTHVQATTSSIKNLETQMGQMAKAITRIDAQTSGNLPSQMVVNPRENISAVTLRSGKQLNVAPSAEKDDTRNEGSLENQPQPWPDDRTRGGSIEEEGQATGVPPHQAMEFTAPRSDSDFFREICPEPPHPAVECCRPRGENSVESEASGVSPHPAVTTR